MDDWCQVCYNINPECPILAEEDDDEGERIRFRRGTVDLESSGSAGCVTCSALLEILLFFKMASKEVLIVGQELQVDMDRSNHMTEITSLSLVDTTETVQVYSPEGTPPALPGISSLPEVSKIAGCDESMSFLKSCITKCSAEHVRCRPSTLEAPTRLLDIGGPGETTFRLVENQPFCSYSALSYCWGRTSMLRTSKSNIDSLKSGFHILELPQTIRDAIKVTKILELRYIWIDALCIIQDSMTDWEIEASRMAAVYRNAHITIASGTAASAQEGFLQHQHPIAKREIFELPWLSDDPLSPRTLRAREVSSHFDWAWGQRQPLDTRCWTLQESVLSNRLILFTKEELVWRCQSLRTCECHGNDLEILGQMNVKAVTRSCFLRARNHAEAFDLWHRIVADYSGRFLSFEKDKLPALSGIASVVQKLVGSQYIAGLWAKNLAQDLSWHRKYSESSWLRQDTQEYRAPTFSWSYVNGPVSFPRFGIDIASWESECSAIDFSVSSVGPNPFGQIAHAWVKLRGYLVLCPLVIGKPPVNNVYEGPEDPEGKDRLFVQVSQRRVHFIPDFGVREFTSRGDDDQIIKTIRCDPTIEPGGDLPILAADAAVFVFHLGSERIPGSQAGRQCMLVMTKLPGDLETYERLGLLDIKNRSWKPWPSRFSRRFLKTVTIV